MLRLVTVFLLLFGLFFLSLILLLDFNNAAAFVGPSKIMFESFADSQKKE